MPLSEKHNSEVKIISEVLEKAGYQVNHESPIGPEEKQRFADIVAFKPEGGKVLLIEVKTGITTGSSDVLTIESYVNSAGSMTSSFMTGRPIEGIIVSGGTIDPAKILSNELGIRIIEANSLQKIKMDFSKLIDEIQR